jgi:hypothetical protein
MKDKAVIKLLGGHKAIKAALGLRSEQHARHFSERGIPWKHRPKIAALAKRKKVQLPSDFLENQRKA